MPTHIPGNRCERLASQVAAGLRLASCSADSANNASQALVLPGVLRTPEAEFGTILQEFPYTPKYVLVGGGLRMAYIDEGPPKASVTFFLLHGEPTYSYLYRKVIPILVAAGHRVLVPDLIGFGRSDKPTDPMQYTFVAHLGWLTDFIDMLDLHGLTFFGHEWGGMLGLSLLVRHEARFHRAAIGNTHLIVPGNRPPWDLLYPYESTSENRDSFLARRVFCPLENIADDTFLRPLDGELQSTTVTGAVHVELTSVCEPLFFDTEDFEAGQVVNDLTLFGINDEARKAYNLPFPSQAFKAGMRRFPMIVPRSPDDACMEIMREVHHKLGLFKKPFLTAFAPADPLLNWADKFWQDYVPGANDVIHARIEDSRHFLQEDQGERLAAVLNAFVASTPVV